MRLAAPPSARPPLAVFDPDAFAGFMAPVQDLDQIRSDRRRVHPPHPPRLDPHRPPGPPPPSSLVDPHPDDAPWWFEKATIDDGEHVYPIMVYLARVPPVQSGLDVRYNPRDETYTAVRLGRVRPSTLFAGPTVGPAA